MNSRTVSFCTLGCRVNQYESDAIAEELECYGVKVVPFGEKCSVTIINTCSVTAESDRKSRQMIRKAKKANPDVKIIVTGCSSQIFPDETSKIGGVTVLVGNGEKGKTASVALSLLDGNMPCSTVSDMSSAKYDMLTLSRARRARAYIKIEDGCENKCAYCIIPRGRGRVRSKPEETIIKETEALVKTCPEIILTGIETASYGKDFGKKDALSSLIKKVAAVKGVERLTVGSLDPNILTEDFLKTVSDTPNFLPHLHLSVQSGSSSTLAAMKRRYNAESALEKILRAKEVLKGVSLSADFIVGFPGESEEDFEKTAQFCRKVGFMHLHIFPFSERQGTLAAEMECKVDDKTKKERAARLAEVGTKIKKELLDSYIREYKDGGDGVLFEQKVNGVNIGHSRHYVEVHAECDGDYSGKTVPVTLTSHNGEICFAEQLEKSDFIHTF